MAVYLSLCLKLSLLGLLDKLVEAYALVSVNF